MNVALEMIKKELSKGGIICSFTVDRLLGGDSKVVIKLSLGFGNILDITTALNKEDLAEFSKIFIEDLSKLMDEITFKSKS